MKYLITESQLDRMVFKYLDSQDFIVKGNDTSLFFINSEDDELAQIRYDEDYALCYINIDLNKEVSSIFSLGRESSQEVIAKWVEKTLETKVKKTTDAYRNIDEWLRIPN
jgi:hypothetical protein